MQRLNPFPVQHQPAIGPTAAAAAKTSVASARTVPGLPSGNSTTNSNTPFHRLNPEHANTLAEQRMRSRGHPHLARQHRPKMLQSVAITPGTGKTHLAIGLGIRRLRKPATGSCSPPPPTGSPAHRPTTPAGCQPTHPARAATALLVIDEVGYLPLRAEAAANLFFQLVSSRYEHASLSCTTNRRSAAGATSSATPSSPPP